MLIPLISLTGEGSEELLYKPGADRIVTMNDVLRFALILFATGEPSAQARPAPATSAFLRRHTGTTQRHH
jgi:hypothetical protein